MSLINDALKRTSEADKLNPLPRLSGPALQPVEEIPSASLPRGGLIGGIASVAGLSAYLLWQYFAAPAPVRVASTDGAVAALARRPAPAHDKSSVDPKGAPTDAHAAPGKTSSPANVMKSAAATLHAVAAQQAEVPTPESPAKPGVPAENKSAAAPAENAPSASPPSEAPPAKAEIAIAPPPPPPPPPPFPSIRVQGVIARSSNPSALINGRVLFLGDQIDDAKITKIDAQGVTFELAGQTRSFPAPH
jgi:hypothetical protein